MKSASVRLSIGILLVIPHLISATDSAGETGSGGKLGGPIPSIDLRDHDFTGDGLARLDGDWAMVWNTLIDPQLVRDELVDTAGSPAPIRFTLPATWNTFEQDGEQLGGRGYASFAVRVLLPPAMRRGAVRVSPASTAYRLWIDGTEVAASGVPGTTPDTTTPGRVVRNPVFETDGGSVLLVMHVANFDHRVGGMWRPIWIGAADEIAAFDIIDISYDLLLLGICLAFAAYNFLIYLAGSRRSIAPLLFAAFFLSVSIRIPTLGAVLATRAVPGFPWHALIFIEYLTGHLIIAFFCGALQHAYPQILGRTFRVTVYALMAAFTVFLAVGGVTRYSLFITVVLVTFVGLLAYPALRLGWAGFHGNREARLGLLAVLVALGIVVSEWAHFSGLVLSRDATPLGFLVGLLSGPPGARAVTHLALTSVTVLVMLAAASLLMYKVSDGLFGAATRETVVRAPVSPPDGERAAAPHRWGQQRQHRRGQRNRTISRQPNSVRATI